MERLGKISQEVVDITKSLEFTQEELHDGLANAKNDIKKVQTDLKEIEDNLLDPTFAMEILTELEDRSRYNDIRIDSILETSNKTWKSCNEKVINIIKNKLNITDDIKIVRCHRIGKFQRNKSKPGTVVYTFLRSIDKHKVFQNSKKLKNTGTFIYEDFSKTTIELRKSLWEEVLLHQQQDKITYLNYRSIVVKDNIVRSFIFCFC